MGAYLNRHPKEKMDEIIEHLPLLGDILMLSVALLSIIVGAILAFQQRHDLWRRIGR
jgi:hypothetical protein